MIRSSLTVVTPATGSVVCAADLREFLRLYDNESDAMLSDFEKDAVDYIERYTSRYLLTTTVDLKLDYFPCVIELRRPPVQSVTSITYLDTNGDSQTLTSSKYTVDTDREPGLIKPAYGETWPATYTELQAVTVRFVCGYADADSVPQGIKTAIKWHVSGNFNGCDNRERVNNYLDRFCWGALT